MATVLTEAAGLPKELATLLAVVHRSPSEVGGSAIMGSDDATEMERGRVSGADVGVPLAAATGGCRCSHVGHPATWLVPNLEPQYEQTTGEPPDRAADWLAGDASRQAMDTLGAPPRFQRPAHLGGTE